MLKQRFVGLGSRTYGEVAATPVTDSRSVCVCVRVFKFKCVCECVCVFVCVCCPQGCWLGLPVSLFVF